MIGYMKNLPPIHRIIFNMFVFDGYTHFEIAKSLDLSVSESRSNLSQARVMLQKIMKDQERMKSRSLGISKHQDFETERRR
jgi:DNA-directed RNA polymerase specialized sigma24 family protein